jgi:hypothetical protein
MRLLREQDWGGVKFDSPIKASFYDLPLTKAMPMLQVLLRVSVHVYFTNSISTNCQTFMNLQANPPFCQHFQHEDSPNI